MFQRSRFGMMMLRGAMLVTPLLGGCGGGDDGGQLAAINVPQCTSTSCTSGPPTSTPPAIRKLCPDALDYTTTYTGGSGSG